jgi:type I restriction enzyme S subunit
MSSEPGAPARGWKPYPAYKDSGVEWLGKVPEHWEIIRLKHLAGNDINVVQTGPFGAQLHASDYVDNGVPLILIRNVNNLKIDDSDIPKISEKKAESLSSYRLEIDDIVFSRVGSIGRIAIVTEREKGWLISGQMLRIRIENPNLKNDFALYVFSSEVISEFVSYKSVGSTRDSINTEILRNVPVLIPPIHEQFFITRYLDDRTRKIDSLIEMKQKLIELLKEERAAVINKAITKGLDPRAPMRDSGVEWLGEVPEKWEVKRLKYLVTLVNEKSNSDSLDIKIALENIESYTGKLVNLDSETIFEGEARSFMRGDVLFNKLRPYLAKVHNAKTNGVCVGELLVFRPSKSLISDFLYYRVLSEGFIKEVNSSTYGAKMPRASWEFIGNMHIPFPAVEEQREIINFIESEYAGIYRVVSKIEKEIALMQEYRTALISEVVTGKIDVRQMKNSSP